jgi:hypothetical protein
MWLEGTATLAASCDFYRSTKNVSEYSGLR